MALPDGLSSSSALPPLGFRSGWGFAGVPSGAALLPSASISRRAPNASATVHQLLEAFGGPPPQPAAAPAAPMLRASPPPIRWRESFVMLSTFQYRTCSKN